MQTVTNKEENGRIKITLTDSDTGIILSCETDLKSTDNFKDWHAYLVADLKARMHILKQIPFLKSKGNE